MPKILRIDSLRLAVSNPVPALIMFAVLLFALTTLNAKVHDSWLDIFSVAAASCCFVRLVALAMTRRAVEFERINRQQLNLIELIFSSTYMLFAATLGALGARAIFLPEPKAHALILTLLVGYAAGVANTLDLKPKTAVPSILLATCPAMITAIGKSDMFYLATGLILLSLIVGGCYTIIHRQSVTNATLQQRDLYRDMAHIDDLTQLPNRAELRLQFNIAIADRKRELIAAHYIDLNGFKKVNDQYGHAAGDDVLKEVAKRLSKAAGPTNIVARLGGDEFVVLQRDIREPRDAEELRVQMRSALLPYFTASADDIEMSASIGTAVASRDSCDLETLLRQADAEQYLEKNTIAVLNRLPLVSV